MKFFSRSSLLISLVFSLLGLTSPESARGQFIGYTSPQTDAETVVNTGAFSCATNELDFPVKNLGQAVHYVAYTGSFAPGIGLSVGVQGSMDGTTWLPISDVATNLSIGAVVGFGYYPIVRVQVKCTGGGTIPLRVNYSGTSVSSPVTAGINDFGAYQKLLWDQTNSGAGQAGEVTPTPYGNTSGVIFITYLGGAGPAGSTIALQCIVPGGTITVLAPTAIATTSGLTQSFVVPAVPCTDAIAQYAPGGAGVGLLAGSYLFAKPGAPPIMGATAGNVFVTNFPTTQAVSGTVTANQGTAGAQAWLADLHSVGGTTFSLGQALKAASLPVTLASDQGTLPVSGTVTTTPPANASTNVAQIGGTAVLADPCQSNSKVYLSQQFTANTQIITGTASKKIYVCSWNIVVGAATNVAVVEGTGSVCGAGTATFPGMTGGTTAATGVNLGANGGLTYGNGAIAVAGEATNADNVCVLISAANQTNVNLSYVVQ
jgi:hypothetical protein